MAYNNDQTEQELPGGSNGRKRKSESHLPRYYRTQSNKKFLSSTIDQLIQPGIAEKLNGYVGRKTAKAFTAKDNYVTDVSPSREAYQFEPATVIKDKLGNVTFYKDYNDYVNQLTSLNKTVEDHSIFNQQEYYAWDPHIDWDKFTNFREYYWLPNGPQSFGVPGTTIEVESTYTVRIGDNVDNNSYIFSPDGLTNNPTITLYRGVTYKFDIDTPNLPFTIKTKKTLEEGFELDSSSILVLEGVTVQGLEKGVSTLQLGTDTPDVLYYVAANDLDASGTIVVKDIEEATFIDVEKEILGKRSYKASNGVHLSNGMKVYFTGEVEPASYATGSFYVEGVGTAIKLIPETSLNIPSDFTQDIDDAFDTVGFDNLPFEQAIGYPLDKDYIVINRSATDGNLWSRYNRWFHKSVIETSAKQNNQPIEVDQLQRAKRPIIEFEPDIKLYKFGTKAKKDVDLVDDFTKDVFSTIEGSIGYNIDGVDIVKGMRILFTADTDILVKNRIFEVDIIKFSGQATGTQTQITLKEVPNGIPEENEVVLALSGEKYKGKMLYYSNNKWNLTQEKSKVNQPPMFDIFDSNGNSYTDTGTYEASTFKGTKLFSYKQGTGTVDSELGFPLSYRSISNVGDIVFNFDLLQDSMTYTIDNEIYTKNTDVGFIRQYTDLNTYITKSAWKKVDTLSEQVVIRQYVFDNTKSNSSFEIDVYQDSGLLDDLWVRVYLNNKLQFINKDYTIVNNVQNNATIIFNNTPNLNDVVLIKTKSKALKNENGFYEIPVSLERNPKNENLQEFTLGEVNDHVSTIVENLDNFDGIYPGVSNLRDLGNVTTFGRRFLQHSSPMNLSLYHITNKDANVIKSLKFARKQYAKFKREFIQIAESLEFQGSIKDHVDKIFFELNKDKNKAKPFYFSDMVPLGAAQKNEYEIIDADEIYFALSKVFDLTVPSRLAVQAYINGTQLIYGKDYTFNDQGFCVITADKQPGDLIEIYEYETTNGSYVPPTPTKLGLYPAYEPEIYVDDTYLTPQKVIQGHDGSRIIAFNDYRDELILELEKRIFNNIKVHYDTSMFDIHNLVPSENRLTGVTWDQLNKTMLSDFIQWTTLVDQDYTYHNFFERTNRFTFNYGEASFASGNKLPGFWRQIFKQQYGTDRPHTHPWEMLGFTVEPKWWRDQYGPRPYTSDNRLMWKDIAGGIVREPNVKYKVLNNYKNPILLNTLPVDENGKLKPPLDAGIVTDYQPDTISKGFKFGDGAPVESAWRNSSEYPFSLITAFVINKPSLAFSTGFDRINQIRNSAGSIVYKTTGKRIKLEDIVFPNTYKDTTQVYTSGLINYIANYLAADVLRSYDNYKQDLEDITNQLGFKVAGFTDKEKFKLLLDSRTPLNQGNVFVPDENYQIFLNTSSPVETVPYSGVIVERRSDGFVIKGYSLSNSVFKYNPAISQTNDPSINIGGLSESYVVWDSGKTYIAGQNVEYQGAYYRTKEQHVSTTSFDDTKFSKLPSLPLIGGRSAYVRKTFIKNRVDELQYGTLLKEVQDVVDFLLGYGSYLEEIGFKFDYFDNETGTVLNWRHSVNEFLFWTTQKWAEGSVITLSPAASNLQFTSKYTTVDNIFDNFYGYTLLKSDGKKLVEDFANLGRQPNEFILSPKNTADGIFYVELPLIQTEHVVLLDNKTVFGDVIFDLQPGYRQERIRVLGYRTDGWDGSLNIPGFIYDDAKVVVWEPWTDYAIGSIVKNKEFYYSAGKKIQGTELFDASQWNILAEKPTGGLYANFEYKVNQFTDFYDLDSDNFDVEQQKMAQHLIGYQKRQYLENIINEDVSQYKFYQGMIREKGTKNALTKLFDALASDDKDSLEFYEEWAIKDGQYGASDGFEEVEFILDESKFRLVPQPIELVDILPRDPKDLVYRIPPYQVYEKPESYSTSPFPAKYVFDSYTKNSGYVNQQDVRGIVTNYDNIIDFSFFNIKHKDYIWVGNENRTWNVYQHIDTEHVVTSVKKGETQFTIVLKKNVQDLTVGEIIGLHSVYDYVEPFEDSTISQPTTTRYDLDNFYKIVSIQNNEIVLETSTPVTDDIASCKGAITKFVRMRASDITDANTIAQKNIDKDGLIWVDSISDTGEWAVYKNANHFNELDRIANDRSGTGHNYGSVLATDDRNTTLVVGAPDNEDGKVFIYYRPTNKLSYTLTQVLEPAKYGDDLERFGAGLSISPDGRYIVIGSPNASNVKTKYQGNFVSTVDYPKGTIVSKDQQLWQALVNIEGQEDNIQFNSFYSVAQTIDELNIENATNTSIDVMLIGNYGINPVTGNYAFPSQPVNHILVRAPLSLYEGSGINDQVKLAWNSITYANQDLAPLVSRAPFANSFAQITDAFLSQEHTIQKKIDAVLYINAATNIVNIGDILQTQTATGIVDYVFDIGAETVLYLKDVNGFFNTEDSLFRDDGDFIGEYIRQAPNDDIDTSEVWGGFWYIDTPTYTPTLDTINNDKAAGLVYYDVISDSTPTGRYYYNSLDYSTTDINSQNTYNAYIRTLTYRGLPGAGGSNDTFFSNLYVVRAPKSLTDMVSTGDTVSLYVNQLPQYTTGDFVNLLDIGLSTAITNKARQIYDIWDGYINLNFTQFDVNGQPFEPRVGDIVRDLNTGATARVTYYQRNSLNATIFVKQVNGTFSVGDDYGQNAEIKFIGTPGDPDVNYQVDRIMGDIQFVSLGYASAGIGKMLVFEAENPIDLSDDDRLLNIEYWMYQEGTVLGIPRPANPPSSINNEWQAVYKIPAATDGVASGLTNEGVYAVYSRAAPGRYDPISTFTVPEKQSNFKLGSEIKITKKADLYKLMVYAEGQKTQANPGRIYFVKNGTDSGITYTWEYSKNKKFRGTFNESLNYSTGDIVYRSIDRGTLYSAKTNLAPGAFSLTDWITLDGIVDYVGYIPNNTGLNVVTDSTDGSTVLDQELLYNFGSQFDVNSDGEVLVVSALYDKSKPNQIVVYRNNNSHYERSQEITAPDKTSGFGNSLAISDDGTFIAVGAPFNDDYKLDQGKVYIYKQVQGEFVLYQELQSPNNERAEKFGWRLQYDGEKLFVTSRNADTKQKTIFDNNQTVFDGSFTEFRTEKEDSGVIFVYEKTPQGMLYAQAIQIVDADVNNFGRTVLAKQNHLYVGLPKKQTATREGQVVDFRLNENVTMWEIHRQSAQTVDIDKLKKVFLYNVVEGEILTYLDYIDPIQGKVAGPAEQELTYKTYFDPASYSVSNAPTYTNLDPTSSWGSEHVGEVWWDLTNAKFYNPYQGSIEYSITNWNKLFQGNTIDVYEWVESDVLPSAWNAQADTENGFKKGYSGQSLYDDQIYSSRLVYDDITKSFKTRYYFWVKNKTIVPNVEFRNISIQEITSYIEDPFAKGHKFVAFISPTRFVIYNCDNLIKAKEVALSVQYWTIDNQTQNIHNQYQIISEGLETSQPNRDIVNKWFDSLIGYDVQGRHVPDTGLSPKKRYGTLNRPRQGWFRNKNEALKQFIERVNSVLKTTILVDDKDITPLFDNDPILTPASNLYDVKINSLTDLNTVGISNAKRAILTPVIQNGKIIDVVITDPGKGYRLPPKVTILGNGTGAEISVSIDSTGKITSAVVVEQGQDYASTTSLSVRRFSVLVENDSTIQGKWALYERINESSTWNRIRSQSYNVALYWNYVDWYETGYSETTNIDYLINNSYELTSLNDSIGDVVKISNVGTGGWLLLEKESNQDTQDYTINYKTIGRQNGTIQFLSTLYDTTEAFTGFDTISFDTKIFDSEPIRETRTILEAIKNNILIDELLVEFNKLFFASLRYVFSEQPYVDWAFKTSFIKAKHNVGLLREDITFNNDNLPSYESYIKEVKPFSTKIREYLSAYEGIDNTGSVTTDFDLPPTYVSTEGTILPQSVKVVDSTLVGVNTNLETYPNKHWLDNSSLEVVSVEPVNQGRGYTVPPILKISGGGGSGAVLKTYLGSSGNVTKVDVINPGTGYYSTPVIEIVGNLADGGEPATFSIVMGNSPVRGIKTTVKFDRTTGTFVYTKIDREETFVTSGNKYIFDLKWPMRLSKTEISVYLDNIELLSDEYLYTNVLDTTKGYDRYLGRIEFIEKPNKDSVVKVEYKIASNLLQAADRINVLYDPQTGQLGKELSQLMSGVDYGGVQVKSFNFGQSQGWDSDTWFDQTWDSYDNTYEDEIFEFDGSTIEIRLNNPLEDGVEYHVYLNNVRLDDPSYDGSTVVSNPNAIMRSLIGDGVTQTMYLDDFKLETYQPDGNNTGANIVVKGGDVLIIRKSTSDGTFLPNEATYDSIIQGGNLNYATATGLNSADITIDGDGFVTPTTSAGPEEQVPGQVLDTVDIKVYERPAGGSSKTTSMNYIGNGITTEFDIGVEPISNNDIFVKVGFNILSSSDYTINQNILTLNTPPAAGQRINILTLGTGGAKIIDNDTITADGSTTNFLTNVRYNTNLQYIITLNGSPVENVIVKSKASDGIPNNALIKLATPPAAGQKLRYVFFEGDIDVKNYSEVILENFVADGSTTSFTLENVPGDQEPAHYNIIVKVNNKILSAGYSKRFVTTETQLEYPIEEFQYPEGSISNKQVQVYLNGQRLEYLSQWTFVGSGGSLIRLKTSVQQADGDILHVFVMSSGEYRFGYFNAQNEYIETPGVLHLDSPYNEDDNITVYQFTNHDWQGFERTAYDVVDRVTLISNTEDWYTYVHLQNGLIELTKPAVDAQYVWVVLNGDLLIPSVHYYVTDNLRYVKLINPIQENDTVQVIHFSNNVTKNKFGWTQFKDILNRTHYQRLTNQGNVKLATDLNFYDQSITVVNGENLPKPLAGSRNPAVIFIEGERIEYFVRNDNVLSQLRRGTLGTGVKDVYSEGTNVYNQSEVNMMPYKDETLTTIFTADGTTSTYELDFIPGSVNEFEVFVAGKRLRKNSIDYYQFEEYNDSGNLVTELIDLDSPEGDVTMPAEFTINGNQLILTDLPKQNTKVVVVRRQGKIWTQPGIPLGESDSDIGKFLRAATVDLPR